MFVFGCCLRDPSRWVAHGGKQDRCQLGSCEQMDRPKQVVQHIEEAVRESVEPCLGDIRIARAVRAGISAAQKLSGERAATVPSVKLCGCPNRWYVCLRGPNHPTGFVTSFYGIYHRNITIAGTTKFHPGGVSHAFPSLAEVTAFLAAARAQWPVELLNNK